jgi:DNA-binding beta-propeller fold protein YncE
VSVVDAETNTVSSTIPVKGRSTALAMAPDGRRVYVGNESGAVQMIDTKSGDVATTFDVGDDVGGIAITPDGRHAYVTESQRDKLHVIELAT